MAIEQPFEIRGAKIPLFNVQGAYADLLGSTLDTSTFIPWSEVIEEIKLIGANSVMLIVSAGVMREASDSRFDTSLNFNPDLAAIRSLATLIKANGMSVSLTTFANVANTISGDPSKVGNDRPFPADKKAWLADFSEREIGWAKFAREIGATAFIPFGDETQHLFRDAELTSGWLQLMGQIRKEFSGALTTSWYTPGYGDFLSAIPKSIFDALDYIGVGLFPNLTTDNNASTQSLINAYRSDVNGNSITQYLNDLSVTYGKKIWITDKAFHSFDGAAVNEVRIFDPSIVLTQDQEEQVRLYESFLQVIANEGGNWLAGVSFQSFNNIQDNSSLVARFANGPLSESPQGKPALKTLSDWFNGLRQGVGISQADGFRDASLTGGYNHDTLMGGLGNDTLTGNGGDDLLIGGPATDTRVKVWKVDVFLRGVAAGGIAPIVKLIDSSGTYAETKTVTGLFQVGKTIQTGEATKLSIAVTDLTYFSVENTNWAFLDFSDTGNRFVRVEAVQVNGVPLDLTKYLTYVPPKPYGIAIGALDSVHGGTFVFELSKLTTLPILTNVSDNDHLVGGVGNDTIDGGAGIDTAIYSSSRGSYTLTLGATTTVQDKRTTAQSDGTDSLKNIERLKFTDLSVATDLDGHAGQAAKLLGAVFGAASVTNKQFVGIALSLLDGGMSYEQLASAALGVTGKTSNSDVASLLWTNLFGVAPTPDQLAPVVAILAGGMSQGALTVLVADTSFNTEKINLVGLTQTGIEFL